MISFFPQLASLLVLLARPVSAAKPEATERIKKGCLKLFLIVLIAAEDVQLLYNSTRTV